jgi:ClpP class serine protease
MLAVSVNSAYGSYVQADLIYQTLHSAAENLDVPVYTFAEDVAVGPGYYILTAGHKVFVDPHSVIGGVSAGLQKLGFEKFVKDWKVDPRFVASGKNKVRLNPFEKVKPEDEAWLKTLLQGRYELFKAHVQKTRGKSIAVTET